MSLEDWEKKSQNSINDSSDAKTKILLSAASTGEKLHIRYSKPSGMDERWITPKRVFSKKGEAAPYLEAHCHKRNERRVFKIKKITIISGAGNKADAIRHTASRTRISSGSVTCSTEYVELDGDYGPIDGVELTCNRCGHVEESFGVGSDSIKRCLALMKEECPNGESNWYIEE